MTRKELVIKRWKRMPLKMRSFWSILLTAPAMGFLLALVLNDTPYSWDGFMLLMGFFMGVTFTLGLFMTMLPEQQSERRNAT